MKLRGLVGRRRDRGRKPEETERREGDRIRQRQRREGPPPQFDETVLRRWSRENKDVF